MSGIAAGSYKQLQPPDIKASGYVVRSLEAVLWAFYHTKNFKDGCLKVGNYSSYLCSVTITIAMAYVLQ